MQEVAKDVWLLDGFPKHAINIYLIGDMLIDSGTNWAKGRIFRELGKRQLTHHIVTHAHPDHIGSSHAVCEKYTIPLWCGVADAPAVEHGIPALNVLNKIMLPLMTGPTHAVDRQLKEGDQIGDWLVLDVPGHSIGHIALWREHDGVLIAGDVFFHNRGVLAQPPKMLSIDLAQNRRSMRKLAALKPNVVCFGHGPPLYDGARLQDFVQQLPQD